MSKSNPNKPDIPKTNNTSVPRPQQPKLLRPFSPGREGLFDVLQEMMFEKLTVPAKDNEVIDFHMATVYKVEGGADGGFFNSIFGADQVRVKARIDEPDTAHSTMLVPESLDDELRIGLLVEFTGFPEQIGGKPKPGDTIEVSFYNKSNKTKVFGNGIINRIVKTSKVAGLENPNSTELPGPVAGIFKPTPDQCTRPGSSNKSSISPAGGAVLTGENRVATVSDRNPRKLNSPTEDTTQAIANSRLPEQQQSTNIPSAGPAPAPQQGFSNNQSTGPGPFEASPGTNQTTPSGGPKKQDPCDGQVAPVGAYRARVAEGRRGIFGLARRAEGEDAEGIPPTWDRATDRRIKKLHPDARQVVADFINFSAEQGYYLRVTETYRTVQRQNELYAKGRTVKPPNRTVTKARGLPKSSIHQFGIAFDCVEVAKGRDKTKNGKRFSTPGIGASGFDKAYPKNRWQEIGSIGKQFGFVWGGNFRGFFDGPHFEVFRARASGLRRKEARGEVIVDPKLGPNYKFPKMK